MGAVRAQVPEASPELLWAALQGAVHQLPASMPLAHMAMSQQLAPEALYIAKLLLSFALPLLFSSLRVWAKVYSVFLVMLIMYSMNSPVWRCAPQPFAAVGRYPHLGFVSLSYLAPHVFRRSCLSLGRGLLETAGGEPEIARNMPGAQAARE